MKGTVPEDSVPNLYPYGYRWLFKVWNCTRTGLKDWTMKKAFKVVIKWYSVIIKIIKILCTLYQSTANSLISISPSKIIDR